MKRRVRIFVSYSHKDMFWQERLMPLLTFPGVQVQPWSDKDMKPGIAWHKQIQAELAEMHVFIPLISQNFAVSDYIARHECPVAKRRHGAGEIEVLPVLISEVANGDCGWILKLQYVPESGRSWVSYLKEFDAHDLALKPIREGVRMVVDRVLAKKA